MDLCSVVLKIKICEMTEKKKEMLKWIAMIGFFLILWVTGWYKIVIVKVQQMVLATGIIQPDMDALENGKQVNAVFLDEKNQRVALEDFRGKVVFMNVWATWCPPCKAEMPEIQDLYGKLSSDSVVFVMLSTDRNFEKAIEFKSKNEYTFPIYQQAENLPIELNATVLPTTYVIDPEGKIRMIQKGMAKYNSAKFIRFLREIATK